MVSWVFLASHLFFLLGTWRGVGEHCIASGLLCILSPSYVRLGVSLFLFKVVGKFVLVGMVAHFVLFFSHPSLLLFLSLGRSVCVSGALCIWVRASVLALVFCFCLGVLSLGVLFGICRSCSTVGFPWGWRSSLRTFLFFFSCVSLRICSGKWCSVWDFDFSVSYPRH